MCYDAYYFFIRIIFVSFIIIGIFILISGMTFVVLLLGGNGIPGGAILGTILGASGGGMHIPVFRIHGGLL